MAADRGIVYLHGGPGMSATAERELIGIPASRYGVQIRFWDEPSPRRPSGPAFQPERAFSALVESAAEAIREARRTTRSLHVVAHSFGALAACHVLADNPSLADRVTLVAPTLAFKSELRNIIGLAAADFERRGDERANELRRKLAASREFFDGSMQSALPLAGADEDLFANYWHDREAMSRYFAILGASEECLDTEVFFLVLKELAKVDSIPKPEKPLSVPAEVIFGTHDPVVIPNKEMEAVRSLFSHVTEVSFERSAHYPQIEEIQRFFQLADIAR